MYEAFDNQTKPLVAFLLVATSLFSGGRIAVAQEQDQDIVEMVQDVVEMVTTDINPKPDIVTARAMQLPKALRTTMLGEVKKFRYESSPECGGHHFTAYEAEDQTLILEYETSPDNSGKERRLLIRDYVYSTDGKPTAKVKGGLWSANDHAVPVVRRPTHRRREGSDGIIKKLVDTAEVKLSQPRPRTGSRAPRTSGGVTTTLSPEDQKRYAKEYHKALLDTYKCQSTSSPDMVAAR